MLNSHVRRYIGAPPSSTFCGSRLIVTDGS